MKNIFFVLLLFFTSGNLCSQQPVPLPEHPRPDFFRPVWTTLNGLWNFEFDPADAGMKEKWQEGNKKFSRQIMVPFPWGSALSGIPDEAEIGWYSRKIGIPETFQGKRAFLVIGASDWHTMAWINGQYLGEFRGGYLPFEFEVTSYVKPGTEATLVIRADDKSRPFKLEGKQGYGNARGIWQTVYLEARGESFIQNLHFTPDIDAAKVKVSGTLSSPAGKKTRLKITIGKGTSCETMTLYELKNASTEFTCSMEVTQLRLWTLEDPFLYETTVELLSDTKVMDQVNSYFGMRKISTVKLPGSGFNYIALNNQPVYLKMTLDQAYHPEGFYTYPTDEFMRDEIIRSKQIGLNCNRIHIKAEIPRKLYWADKLGLLIMADVPNSWGQPDPPMRQDWEKAMRGIIERDYNHPSIFSWILFNETWGLFAKTPEGKSVYADSTAAWVKQTYFEAKKLDPSRLVEDNSACNYDHVVSDMNTWHAYLPGYAWKEFLKKAVDSTFVGSGWNYRHPEVQNDIPMLNSECGNVWGYAGSTGDVDWSWDYHIMMNEMRLQPKIAGWLYTEHHDVINEWNGYFRYDRSEKFTGMEELVPGMTLNDLHSDVYLVPDYPLCSDHRPNEKLSVPLKLSVMSGKTGPVTITMEQIWTTTTGSQRMGETVSRNFELKPWHLLDLGDWTLDLPSGPGLVLVTFRAETPAGRILNRNFFTVNVTGPDKKDYSFSEGKLRVLSVKPDEISRSAWSVKEWKAMNNKKVNGTGTGYFEYKIQLPGDLSREQVAGAGLVMELSSKKLHGKDAEKREQMGGDYMRGAGTFDPSLNPNAYPMTDTEKYPGLVKVWVNDKLIGSFYLEDDPADHRGILSWHAQEKNGKLDEAGSYGYLVRADMPDEVLNEWFMVGEIRMRLAVEDLPSGLAVYGRDSGRYPVDPSVIFLIK